MRKAIVFVLVLVFVRSSLFAQTIDEIREINIPVLIINTVNDEEPTFEVSYRSDSLLYTIKNATKVPGKMIMLLGKDTLYNSSEYVQKQSGLTIKIRGNSSAVYPKKKPYKLKLQKAEDLFMRGNKFADKNWILINDEKHKINTLIGLKINELMGMQFAPHGEMVNVFLNGTYRGLYILTESEERNTDCRVNVSKNGFIFESDPYWWNEDVAFHTTINSWYSFGVTFKYPDTEDITEAQITFLKHHLESFEETLLSDGDYTSFIDLDSWAAWLLAHDILGTYDCAGSNIYFALYDSNSSSKIFMPNLWDYDTIMMTPETWARIHDCTFYFQLLLKSKNPAFRRAYIKKWHDSSDKIFNGINQFLDSLSAPSMIETINNAKSADAAKWNYSYSDIRDDILESRNWFSKRREWLNNQINILEAEDSISSIFQPKIQTMEKTTIFNLQGQRLTKFINGINIVNGKKIIKNHTP